MISTLLRHELTRTVVVAVAVGAAALALWGTNSHATAAAGYQASQPSNTATINLQKVLTELKARETMEADLQLLLSQLQTELDQLNKEREGALSDLELLQEGSRAYQSKIIQIRELEGLLQYRRNLFDQQILIEKGRILRDLYNQIAEAAKRVSEREGYGLVVIDDSSMQLPKGDVPENNMLQLILSRRVMANNGGHDISALVIQLMNAQGNSARP